MFMLNGSPSPKELLGVNVTEKFPVLLGVPLIEPVVALNLNPTGSLPFKANEVALALTVGIKLNGVPTVAFAVELFEITGDSATVTYQLGESTVPTTVVPLRVVTRNEYEPELFAVTAGIV
jgi:hypothetical protein